MSQNFIRAMPWLLQEYKVLHPLTLLCYSYRAGFFIHLKKIPQPCPYLVGTLQIQIMKDIKEYLSMISSKINFPLLNFKFNLFIYS